MPLSLSKWFTPPGYSDDVAIQIQPMSVPEWEKVERLATGKSKRMALTNHIIDCCILGWRGIKAVDGGEDIPFTRGEFTRLPIPVQTAVIDEVYAMSGLTRDEEKNSESQSTSPAKGPRARARSTAKTASTAGTATKPTRRRSRPSK